MIAPGISRITANPSFPVTNLFSMLRIAMVKKS